MKSIAIFSLIFLLGCTTYTPTQEITNFKLNVEFDKASLFGNYDGYADWSAIYTTGCRIYIPSEIDDYTMMVTGHELYHCIYGNYHDDK